MTVIVEARALVTESRPLLTPLLTQRPGGKDNGGMAS
jgi:hypothetical protein